MMKEIRPASSGFANSQMVDLLHLIIFVITMLTLLIALTGGALWLWGLLLASGILIGCWAMKLENAKPARSKKSATCESLYD